MGVVDLILDYYHAVRVGLPALAGQLGATYAIPRLGLRAIYFSDGPVGPRQGTATAMPIPMALAATWSPGLAYQHGREIAQEAYQP